ncbi:CmlA/FloR family chloramphenicol efflux MFS transporter [Xenorhabdus szentirmaii]|uniref:CmlA/FloR family chloramphenicol efflux MFS transporter n=1 Tax=Xenorhabdus szentirmaii TaxID=290112 RepID=UPI00199CE5C2|nr:CmlA/FloR family chloramphenicol efflux MFS transporter [Xenorhabdus sp. 38]MBD2780664.1 CmlA/FloR family chloramphenicol efflux MFS transporter [Xenorhabdus sp. 38]
MSNKTSPVWGYSLSSALVLMAPFDLLASLAMDVYLPVIPDMPAALDTSPAIVQLTLSIYMILLGFGQLIYGPLSDSIGRRPVVLGGTLLFSIASFALAMISRGELFVALRVLQALGASAALVATFATVRDVYADRPESSVIYSLFSSMLAFVPAFGPILGSVIALAFGWQGIFVMLGMLGLLAFAQALPRWHETRPPKQDKQGLAIVLILSNKSFWIYTLGFSAALGSFFVFFSTAPRVLMGLAGFSQIEFSIAFATVALVMIAVTRFAKLFVARWGIQGSFLRGLLVMMAGAIILAACAVFSKPSFITFVMPMWLIAVGMVTVVSVTANGALRDFGDASGTAVALYYCIQSLIVGGVGTLMTLVLSGDTAWPLVVYSFGMPAISFIAFAVLKQKTK